MSTAGATALVGTAAGGAACEDPGAVATVALGPTAAAGIV